MPKSTEKAATGVGFDLSKLISEFEDAPEVSTIIPQNPVELISDIAKVQTRKSLLLSTKLSFQTHGWNDGNYAMFAGVLAGNEPIKKKDANLFKFVKSNFIKNLSTGLGIQIEYVCDYDRNGIQTGISLFVSSQVKKVIESVSELLKAWKIEPKIFKTKNAFTECGVEKEDQTGNFVPMNLGQVWGRFVLINPTDVEKFKTPKLDFDWPMIDSRVRLNISRGNDGECRINRIINNLKPIDFNFHSNFIVVYYSRTSESTWEIVVNKSVTDSKFAIKQFSNCFRSSKDQRLSDLISEVVGSSIMEIVNKKCNLVESLDRIEDATDEIYSKNEIEPSDLIFIANGYNPEFSEKTSIGEIVSKVDEFEEETSVEESAPEAEVKSSDGDVETEEEFN